MIQREMEEKKRERAKTRRQQADEPVIFSDLLAMGRGALHALKTPQLVTLYFG